MKQNTNEQTCNNNRPHRLVGKSIKSVLETWPTLETEPLFSDAGHHATQHLSVVNSAYMQIVFLKLFINDVMTLRE